MSRALKIADHVQNIAPSITLAITAKANAMKRDGLPVLAFSAGEPDFDTPEFIKDAARAALTQGKTKYTPVAGISELRQAVCAKLARDNDLSYQPDQVLVSCGAKQSVAVALEAALDPGDEVLVPAPYWVSYPEMVALCCARAVIVPTEADENFCPRPEALERALTGRTRALILNTPGNPTGGAWTREQLRPLADFAHRHDLLVLSDEIYEFLIYDGREHVSFAALSEDARARTVTINGVSKTFAMTGWRIGYAAGPKALIAAMESVQSHVTSGANTIAQYAALAALNVDPSMLEPMRATFDRRRRRLVERLNAIDGIECRMPGGAFYAFPKVSGLYGRSIAGIEVRDSMSFCEACLEGAHLAFVPGIGFGADDYVRLSYACADELIEEGMNRLAALIDSSR